LSEFQLVVLVDGDNPDRSPNEKLVHVINLLGTWIVRLSKWAPDGVIEDMRVDGLVLRRKGGDDN